MKKKSDLPEGPGRPSSYEGPRAGHEMLEWREGGAAGTQFFFASSIRRDATLKCYWCCDVCSSVLIQAGVTVKFSSGANLVMSWPSGGVLQAIGTSSSPILFTANGSTTPGFWAGVYLGNLTPTTTEEPTSKLNYHFNPLCRLLLEKQH